MAFLGAIDVIEIAVEAEKSVETFYRALSARAKAPGAQSVFECLAEQKADLVQVFSKLPAPVCDSPVLSESEWDEYLAYLDAFIRQTFLTETPSAMTDEIENEQKAASIATDLEQKMLSLFDTLRDMVSDAAQEINNREGRGGEGD